MSDSDGTLWESSPIRVSIYLAVSRQEYRTRPLDCRYAAAIRRCLATTACSRMQASHSDRIMDTLCPCAVSIYRSDQRMCIRSFADSDAKHFDGDHVPTPSWNHRLLTAVQRMTWTACCQTRCSAVRLRSLTLTSFNEASVQSSLSSKMASSGR
jgi:hypothetical protein